MVHWPLVGGLLHLVQRGGDWAGCGPVQAPPCCTKCNSPPINGHWPVYQLHVFLCGTMITSVSKVLKIVLAHANMLFLHTSARVVCDLHNCLLLLFKPSPQQALRKDDVRLSVCLFVRLSPLPLNGSLQLCHRCFALFRVSQMFRCFYTP